MIAHSHDDLLFFCLLSAAFLAFPKKPPRVSPLRVACVALARASVNAYEGHPWRLACAADL